MIGFFDVQTWFRPLNFHLPGIYEKAVIAFWQG